MKRLTLIVLCIIGIISSLSAKKVLHEEWELFVGPKLGVNYYNLTSLEGKGSIAPIVGGQGSFFVSPNLSVGMELCWTQGGTYDVSNSLHQTGSDGTIIEAGKYDFTMNFVNVNFILKYYLNSHVGIFTGFNEENIISPKLKTEKLGDYEVKDDVANIGLSIPLGISYDVNKDWSVALQYNLGVKKFAGDDAKAYLKSAKNQQIMLSVAYNFQIM